MASTLFEISNSICRWRLAVLEHLRATAGEKPSEWLEMIKQEGKIDFLPKTYEKALRSPENSIPLRVLLGAYETIRIIKMPSGRSNSILLKADEILINFYALKKENPKNEKDLKKLHAEAEEWLRNLSGSSKPSPRDERKDVLACDRLITDLENDPIFMAMYAKSAMKSKLALEKMDKAGIGEEVVRLASRIRSKGKIEFCTFIIQF